MGKSKELQLAIQAAKAAGNYLRKETAVQVDSAEGKDIKLSSDKKSEQIIMDILEESNLPILSEEYGLKGKTGTEYWIVDPLDGTVNYYKGFREMACVSIALWREDRPVLGVVYRFMVDELFYGEEGYGAYLNDQPIHTASVREVPKAVIATGFPVNRTYGTESLMRFIRQVQCFKKIRLLGGAATMSAFVACGRFDAYFEENIMLWDVAAGVLLVNAAGGYAEIELLEDYKCICRCFATKDLLEDYRSHFYKPKLEA